MSLVKGEPPLESATEPMDVIEVDANDPTGRARGRVTGIAFVPTEFGLVPLRS